jgi:hypothetical protein
LNNNMNILDCCLKGKVFSAIFSFWCMWTSRWVINVLSVLYVPSYSPEDENRNKYCNDSIISHSEVDEWTGDEC